MTLTIAVGVTEAGELKSLYPGKEIMAAQDATEKAGQAGQIHEGYVFQNPLASFPAQF